MKPLISVIMPAYNAEEFAARAIESILNQTFKRFELIIIDDASKDGTLSVVKSYAEKDSRIRVLKNTKNLRIAETLNKGMRVAKTEIIARMDADDVSHPKRLEFQYKLLKKKPDVAIVGANMVIIDREGEVVSKREYPTGNLALKKLVFRYSPFAHPVVMYRKRVVEEYGGYDSKMIPCEDIDLWFKVGSKYDFASISKPLLKYTLIPGSSSHTKLRDLELLGFRIKLRAIKMYNFKPSLYDVFYNLAQFLSLWVMPVKFRIWLFNFLRSNKLI